jgi:hypothetical protein
LAAAPRGKPAVAAPTPIVTRPVPTLLRVAAVAAVVALPAGLQLASLHLEEYDALVEEEAAEENAAAASATRVEDEERSIVGFVSLFDSDFFLSWPSHFRSKNIFNENAFPKNLARHQRKRNVPRPAPPEGSSSGAGIVPAERNEQARSAPSPRRRRRHACLSLIRLLVVVVDARPRAAFFSLVVVSPGLQAGFRAIPAARAADPSRR